MSEEVSDPLQFKKPTLVHLYSKTKNNDHYQYLKQYYKKIGCQVKEFSVSPLDQEYNLDLEITVQFYDEEMNMFHHFGIPYYRTVDCGDTN